MIYFYLVVFIKNISGGGKDGGRECKAGNLFDKDG